MSAATYQVMNTFELLQTLTETPGPSGFERDIAAVIEKIWQPLVDEIRTDRLGNLIAIKKGSGRRRSGEDLRPRILLAAHMDEIGLMVSRIIDFHGQGFLRVVNLGGVDIRHLYGQRVVVHGRDGDVSRNLKGIIGAPPDSYLPVSRRDKPFDLESLVVDPGMAYDELIRHVSVGDAVTFHQPLLALENNRVAGKALDNRCSVAALTVCLEVLKDRTHAWDVVAIATCQEETRLLGAATTAFELRPDIAIALDVTFGNGPGASDERTLKLDEGPVISFSPDTHPGICQGLKAAAERLEMSVQSEFVNTPGGTDAYAMQVARDGVPTGIIGVALRYMHTMVESINLKDVERTGRLLGEYILHLDGQTLSGLAEGLMSEK